MSPSPALAEHKNIPFAVRNIAAAIAPFSNRTSPDANYRGAANSTGGGGYYYEAHDFKAAMLAAVRACNSPKGWRRASAGQRLLALAWEAAVGALGDSQLDGEEVEPYINYLGARLYTGDALNMALHPHGAGRFPSRGTEPHHSLLILVRFGAAPKSGFVYQGGSNLLEFRQPFFTISVHDATAQARGPGAAAAPARRKGRVEGDLCVAQGGRCSVPVPYACRILTAGCTIAGASP
jgi:hypothetical protein